MSSYISVGFVDSKKRLREDLPQIVGLISTKIEKAILNYAIDAEGEEWNEEIIEDNYLSAFDKLFTYKYSSAKLFCDCNNKRYEILVSIRSNEDLYYGLLFEISEEFLFDENYSEENMKQVTNEIINLMYKMYDVYKFDYAFCDNETDIEYPLDEVILNKESLYSILLYKDNIEKLKLILNSWNIDGITPRAE